MVEDHLSHADTHHPSRAVSAATSVEIKPTFRGKFLTAIWFMPELQFSFSEFNFAEEKSLTPTL